MDARQAHTLQRHALASLGELRSFLGARAAQLPPSAAEGASGATYITWGIQVEAAIRAVSKAFAECERRSSPPPAPVDQEPDSVPPTLPSPGVGRADGSLPPTSSGAPAGPRRQASSSAG